ncbi:MAG: FkbM family methyltransferase [Pseudomonadota bacterium]
MKSVYRTLKFLFEHPLSEVGRLRVLLRYLRWQVSSLVLDRQSLIPWVGESKYLLRRGETGLSANFYVGLADFEEMCLILHLLRRTDLFVDIGANVGSYTILASAAAGANTVSVEPVPETYEKLRMNVVVNEVNAKVRLLNIGIASLEGSLQFITGQDTRNRVVPEGSAVKADQVASIAVKRLDDVIGADIPLVIKVDVEGYEAEVFAGASKTLSDPGLRVLIVEYNECAASYYSDSRSVLDYLSGFGFEAVEYHPYEREISKSELHITPSNNVILVRDIEFVQARVKSAGSYSIFGVRV